ncbi:MAG TPA: hypothetical protein VED46_09445 [Alphaproteobacteria bacterium]|nr:hypothetical protein [Alphaproteobacteria bacterium]
MAWKYRPATPRDPDLLKAVALVAIRHGHHDFSLKMALKSVMELGPTEAREKFSGWGSGRLRKKLFKECKKRIDKNAMALLQDFIDRSVDATDERNKAVHGFWCWRGRDRIVVEVDKYGRPWPTPAELQKLAKRLNDLAYELNCARRCGWLKASLASAAHPGVSP